MCHATMRELRASTNSQTRQSLSMFSIFGFWPARQPFSRFQEDMGNETKRRKRNETKRKTQEPKRNETENAGTEKKRKRTETKRNGTGKNPDFGNETKRNANAKNRYEPETKWNETPGTETKRNETQSSCSKLRMFEWNLSKVSETSVNWLVERSIGHASVSGWVNGAEC